MHARPCRFIRRQTAGGGRATTDGRIGGAGFLHFAMDYGNLEYGAPNWMQDHTAAALAATA